MYKPASLTVPTQLWGDTRVSMYGGRRREIIICVPGFGANGDHPTITAMARIMQKRGVAVITFAFPDGTAANIRKQVAFILDIVTYCRSTYPDANISLLGGSLGALSSAIAATESDQIHRLITLNGYFGSFFLRGESVRVYLGLKLKGVWDKEIRDDLWGFIRSHFRPERIRVPSLVIHAHHDKVAYPIQSRLFFRKLPGKKKLLVYPSVTADHELRNMDDIVKVLDEVIRFLRVS